MSDSGDDSYTRGKPQKSGETRRARGETDGEHGDEQGLKTVADHRHSSAAPL